MKELRFDSNDINLLTICSNTEEKMKQTAISLSYDELTSILRPMINRILADGWDMPVTITIDRDQLGYDYRFIVVAKEKKE